MKTYKVEWTEYHSVSIKAENEQKAKDKALNEYDPKITLFSLNNTTIEEVQE